MWRFSIATKQQIAGFPTISLNFPTSKKVGDHTVCSDIVISDLFIGKSKICFNRKSLPMFGGTFSAAGMCRSRIIHDRINPCIANQIQIRIFINDEYQILFCIPAVTKDDDMIFAVKFRHNLPDHGGCQFQFRFFFLPHTIAKRRRVPRRIFCEERIVIAFVIPGKPLSKKKIQY